MFRAKNGSSRRVVAHLPLTGAASRPAPRGRSLQRGNAVEKDATQKLTQVHRLDRFTSRNASEIKALEIPPAPS